MRVAGWRGAMHRAPLRARRDAVREVYGAGVVGRPADDRDAAGIGRGRHGDDGTGAGCAGGVVRFALRGTEKPARESLRHAANGRPGPAGGRVECSRWRGVARESPKVVSPSPSGPRRPNHVCTKLVVA